MSVVYLDDYNNSLIQHRSVADNPVPISGSAMPISGSAVPNSGPAAPISGTDFNAEQRLSTRRSYFILGFSQSVKISSDQNEGDYSQ